MSFGEPERLNTGTGAERRRLTDDEAARGALPTPFTKAEWQAMKDTVITLDIEMMTERVRSYREIQRANRHLSAQASSEDPSR